MMQKRQFYPWPGSNKNESNSVSGEYGNSLSKHFEIAFLVSPLTLWKSCLPLLHHWRCLQTIISSIETQIDQQTDGPTSRIIEDLVNPKNGQFFSFSHLFFYLGPFLWYHKHVCFVIRWRQGWGGLLPNIG